MTKEMKEQIEIYVYETDFTNIPVNVIPDALKAMIGNDEQAKTFAFKEINEKMFKLEVQKAYPNRKITRKISFDIPQTI